MFFSFVPSLESVGILFPNHVSHTMTYSFHSLTTRRPPAAATAATKPEECEEEDDEDTGTDRCEDLSDNHNGKQILTSSTYQDCLCLCCPAPYMVALTPVVQTHSLDHH